jgi:NADH-quinone oxidoreductase subunit J
MHSINWHSVFFLLFSLLACMFALAVVFSSHIVRMAFYLVLSLGATAGLFFLAGADFVGSMQLLIYVGGTLVLLVFGVMLTAQGPFVSMKTRSGDWIMSALVGGSLLAVLVPTAFKIGDWQNQGRATDAGDAAMTSAQAPPTATRLGLGLLGARVDRLDRPETPLTSTMAGYLLPFEIVSVHLLVVLIGAAYLARTKRRKKVSGTNSALDV